MPLENFVAQFLLAVRVTLECLLQFLIAVRSDCGQRRLHGNRVSLEGPHSSVCIGAGHAA